MTTTPSTSELAERRRTRRLIVGVGLLLCLPTLAGLLVRNREEQRLERHYQQLVKRFETERWDRPVLRGQAIQANAAKAQWEVIENFGILKIKPETLGLTLHSGEARREVSEHKSQLQALRRTTQCAWTWNGDFIEEAQVRAGAAQRRLQDRRQVLALLLASALEAGATECLRIAADTVRLTQDLVPGQLLLWDDRDLLNDALALAAHCAARANHEERLQAAHEFLMLARDLFPIQRLIEDDAFTMLAIDRAPLVRSSTLYRLRERTAYDDLMNRWRYLDEELQLFATLPAQTEPASLKLSALLQSEVVKRWDVPSPTTAAEVSMAENNVAFDNLWLRARLRITSVNLAIDPASPQDETWRARLTDPVLQDPFTGKPLLWKLDGSGHPLIYSAGPNGKDDGATRDDVRLDEQKNPFE